MGFIYKITNTLNGKAYIGQTTLKLKQRMNVHFRSAGCPVIHNAIQKYGRDAFTVEILHEVLDIFLDDLEIAEIKRHNTLVPNGYNLDGGGNTNKVVSDQTRKKLSDAHKGRKRKPLSPEQRQKLSKINKGKKLSPEHRQKMSESQKKRKRKPRTPETRRKISISLKGRKYKPRTPETRRKIGEANAHPDRTKALAILNSLPADMPLKERRKHLRNEFPERDKTRIREWVQHWASKTSSPCAPSDRHIAFEILNSLPADMPLKERRKHLRNEFPERRAACIYKWVKKWSETSL